MVKVRFEHASVVGVEVVVLVRVGACVVVRVGVFVRVGVGETKSVGVRVRVGVGEMNPIGVQVGVAEGPNGVRVRVDVAPKIGVAEGTGVQVEVLAGSSVGVLERSISLPSSDGIGVSVAPSPVQPASVTIAVKVAPTAVSTSPGATMVPSLGALAVERI